MATKESMQLKKEYAKLLYSKQGVTSQKELSERVKVSEVTISKWINKENWKTLLASVLITKEEQLHRLYAQVVELNTAIQSREEGQRYASSKEADALVKLTTAIKQLETDTSISDAIEVLNKFIVNVRQEDFKMAQTITKYADAYVKSLL